jgi:hypothetical protein
VHSLTHPLTLALSSAVFLLLPALLRAQEIIITLNIVPPYSAYVYDYSDLSGQAVITLTNTTQELKQVRLEGILANATSGLFVRTDQGHRGPSPIIVPPGGSVVLSTQPGVMDFLAPEFVTTNANDQVQQAIVQTGQLPEGMYRLCVEAYDYNGPQLLSQPGGGCFSFGLFYANPPIITQPVNGTEINAYMTNPVFSWTPPLGNLAGALIEYDLLVTPVFAGQNPNDAIIAARTYRRGQPILVKEGLLSNVYVRQVFDLALEQGKQYAMQVTARDRNGVVGISNQGRSEISVFTVGSVDTPVIPYGGTGPGPGGPIIDPGISPAFLANTLTGKLHYFWHHASNHGATSSTGSGGALNPGMIGAIDPGTVSAVTQNDGNRSGFGAFTQAPLAGVTVQLVQAIQFQSAPTTTPLAGPLLPGNILMTHTGQFHILNQPTMSAPTLATSTTDAQGNFVFNVPHVQQLDFGWKQGTVTLGGDFTGNLEGSYTGTFRRVLMVRVGNPARTYYAQPVQYNASLPTNGDLGLFHAQVKSFDTKVLVAERQDLSIKKAGLRVYLLRKTNTRPTLVPKDEGKRGDMSANPIITVNLVQYEVLDSAITDAQGMAEFRDLVRFDCSSTSSNNLYYLWSKPVDEFFTQHSVHNTPQPVNYMYQNDWSSAACYNPAMGAIMASCMKCNLADRDGYSTASSSHARAYRGQDQWLYNVNRVIAQNPRVTAFVKNSAAGAQAQLAMNEPGVTWRLWRLNRAAADHLRNGTANWGVMLENNQPDAFIMAQNALTQVGKPMVLQEMGATGSDGRIHSGFLPVQMNSSNEQIGNFYVLDLQKQGFRRKIHVVNRLQLASGTTVNAGQIGSLPNLSGLIGGNTSSGSSSSSSSGSAASAPPPVGDVAMLRRGYQYNQGELWIDPSSTLTLTFIDPAGQPVKCNSYYWDHVLGVEGVMAESDTLSNPRRECRVMQVPGSPLNQLRVVVIPNNSDLYQRDTILVSVPVGASVSHTVTVPYRLHRIHFVVREEPGNTVLLQPGQDPETAGTRIANARVVLMGTNAQMFPAEKHPDTSPGGAAASVAGNVYERITDSQGRVDFAFKASAGESFTFRVMTPTGGPHVTREVVVSSTAGKRWQVKNVQLERGRTVRGRVMIDSAAVAGAKVRWERGGLIAEATTNAQGEYQLTNVPQGHCKFYATKSPYIGMELDEAQPNSSSYGTVASSVTLNELMDMVVTRDFQLRVYAGMDFSSILGFPLEVTAFQELPADRAQISGWITVPDSANGLFRITQLAADGTDLRCVRFLNTVVEKDVATSYTIGNETVSPTKPVNLPMSLGVNEVAIGLYPTSGPQPFTYHGTLRDTQTGIALDRPAGGDTRGAVMGGVRVAAASFTDNNFALNDASISLVAPQGGMRLAAFASDARSWYPAGEPLNVANAQGQPFNYVLHGFQANSVTASSYLYKDSLVLDTRIHTALEHIPAPDNDLNLAIGRIRISGGQLQPFSGARSFTIPLGQFSLQGTELSMNNSGFGFKGVLNASGMELQVENGTLEPHRFLLGEMTASNMKLMGTIPVNTTRAAEFGYDAVRPQPAWYVVVTSRDENITAATISGQHLDGIPSNRNVPISSVWLFSTGQQEVSLTNGIPGYDFFGISQFHLQSMLIGPTMLTLSGELSLGIPGMPTFTTALLYNKLPNGISGYTLQDFAMPPVGLNGVQLAFNKGQQRGSFGVAGNQNCITFAQGQLTIKGVISDQDPNVFKNLAYTLVKTPQQTKLTVDRNPQQSVRLGGDNPSSRILMTDVEGEMWVVNGSNGPEWNTFYIKGNMPADMGFEAQNGQPQRMRFEVRGDLAVENQQVKLKDIETPFGNINMVYDMQHHRLSGQLNVAHGVSGGPSMNGTAAIVIDKEGFYFMSGLNVNLPDPQITGMAFVLLGDYAQRTPEMDALLMQYSVHVQKKMEREVPAFLIPLVQQLLAENPQAGVSLAQGLYSSGNLLPPTYLGLFGSGRFNGFYFNAGAQIPLPVIPNFSIDCSPVATLEMGCDGGIDVRFGANFGSGTYGVGFDTYVDIYMAGGASAGVICAYGRIGLYLTVGLDGLFSTNGNYTITGNGAVRLQGNVTVGGGMCSLPCNDITCLHFNVGGTIDLGMQANISNSGSDFRFTMGNNGTSSQRNDPPPQEN